MKTIRIDFRDFKIFPNKQNNFVINTLKKHYDVVIDEEKPDYVFFGATGELYLKYDGVRIQYIAEPICPDFNMFDYSIGFDDIKFGDRYIHWPLCIAEERKLNLAMNKHLLGDEEFLSRQLFCNSVISSGGGHVGKRDRVYDEISKYKKIDSGGRYRNNLPDGKPVKDKLEFQKKYKFSLALENASYPGYTTEKIMDAWAAGSIPIYWGDPTITREFNPKSFVEIPQDADFEEVRNRIREIDENEELYLSMQHEPILLPDSGLYEKVMGDELDRFLIGIFEQPLDRVYRRSSKFTMLGRFREYDAQKWDRFEHSKVITWLRKTKRKYLGLKKIEGANK